MSNIQLTLKDLQQLDRLRQTNREAMYRHYARLTGSDMAALMANIASQEGVLGRFIKVASRKVKEKSDNPFGLDLFGRIIHTNIGQFPKEGIETLSQDVADNVYTAIKQDMLQGGTGVLSTEQLLKADRTAWDKHGIGEFYPGNEFIGLSTLDSDYLSLGRMANSFLSLGSAALDEVVNIVIERETKGPVPTPDSDDYYVPPFGYPDPTADNPDVITGNQSSSELGGSSGGDTLSFRGFFSPISDFFGGLFGGSSSGSTSQLMPRSGGGFTRTSTVTPSSVEGIIGQALEKQTDSIVEKITKKNPNMFQASVGHVLSQSVERFGDALHKMNFIPSRALEAMIKG